MLIMSPNRRVNENRIKILVLGCKAKTKITQIFSSNNFESTSINKDDDDEYDIKVGLNNLVYYITIIDSSKSDNDYSMRMDYYQRSANFLYFFDNSIKEFDQFYKESKEVWNDDAKHAVVVCNGILSTSSKYSLSESQYSTFKIKYQCDIFEINSKKHE